MAWPPGATVTLGGNTLEYEDPVSDALAELERVADEKMREDESIDPPNVDQPEAPAQEESPGGERRTRGAAAPIARVPVRDKSAASQRRGWAMADLIVALIALAVLALSINIIASVS